MKIPKNTDIQLDTSNEVVELKITAAITTKARDMGLTIPVLSDPALAVSRQYQASSYGMMGASRDGHTFILVGPDGTIRWRADYGGPPKYTMFLPTSSLLADIKAGEHPS